MLGVREIHRKKMRISAAALVFAAFMQCGMTVHGAELPPAVPPQTVSDNMSAAGFSEAGDTAGSVSDNSVPEGSVTDSEVIPGGAQTDVGDGGQQNPGGENAVSEEAAAAAEPAAEPVPVQTVDSSQLQTLNYKGSILTDWQQINDALRTLSPDSITNPDGGSMSLVLQLQNVSSIPAEIKDSLVSDGSGYTKYLHCNIGCGASLVFSGGSDNSGFNGVGNASVTGVDSEKRGKKSMAVLVRFASHEDLGTTASLHVNLPQCAKGTKVSIYAETVSLDEEGNVTVGENACIGTTKADENGNVEVPIQSTANYMFVYKFTDS